MDTFRDRVRHLWPNVSLDEIASYMDLSYVGLKKIFDKGGLPKAESLLLIEQKTNCDLKWLMTGEGEPFPNKKPQIDEAGGFTVNPNNAEIYDTLGNPIDLEEFVFIPRYDVYAAAGHGFTVEQERVALAMAFRKHWIKNYLNANPENLSVIRVTGDSMEPVLKQGDNILINHAQNKPDNGLYVLRVGDNLIVKQTQLLPGGRLLCKSANELYEPFKLDLKGDYEDVQIIGRVEWYGRTL